MQVACTILHLAAKRAREEQLRKEEGGDKRRVSGILAVAETNTAVDNMAM